MTPDELQSGAQEAVRDNADARQSVVLAICSCQRPELLTECLASIRRATVPANWDLTILVVENDSHPRCKELVEGAGADDRTSVKYVLECDRGIPIARNRALDMADSEGFDWLIFIDDDQLIGEKMFLEYEKTRTQHPDRVIQGAVTYLYPPNAEWLKAYNQVGRTRKNVDGQQLTGGRTNNVMISRALFSNQASKLRFDPVYRYSGGEDTEFFHRALEAGYTIVYAANANADEPIHAARINLRYVFGRKVRERLLLTYMAIRRGQERRVIPRQLRKALREGIQALLSLGASLLLFPLSRDRARVLFYKGHMKLARSIGRVQGVLGLLPQPYKTVDGG